MQRLACPTCGGPLPIFVPDQTERAACPSCSSLFDFESGALEYLKQLDQPRIVPLIPIGSEGTLLGERALVIGFMQRYCIVDGTRYSWREYLVHTEQGYRFLMEDDGHFTYVRPINAGDVQVTRAGARYEGRTYRRFSAAQAIVSFVIGEFYWRVEVGERVAASDFIAPPYIVSEERSADEVVWSGGQYLPGKDVWKAFGLRGSPPKPRGVAPAQPGAGKLRWTGVTALALSSRCASSAACSSSARSRRCSSTAASRCRARRRRRWRRARSARCRRLPRSSR